MKKERTFKSALIAILLTLSSSMLLAQEKGNFYIGIQADITVEKEYVKGEFDFNAFPLVLQYHISDPVALRLSPILNIHKNQGLALSHMGGQIALPWYFLHQKETDISGFFLAPLVGIAYNKLSSGTETSLAIEPGFTWYSKSGFTINLGVQIGGTYFTANDATAGWRNHFGTKFNLGYTF